jgi:hypothetical protein
MSNDDCDATCSHIFHRFSVLTAFESPCIKEIKRIIDQAGAFMVAYVNVSPIKLVTAPKYAGSKCVVDV